MASSSSSKSGFFGADVGRTITITSGPHRPSHPPSIAPPVPALLKQIDQGASGEFVCVTTSAELHVYLQDGRIAWATDSTAPFAFRRHLLSHTQITEDALAEVFETCRRDRLAFGETLIAWRLATLEEIRAALRSAIDGALTSLRSSEPARTIFLERRRQYASYDTRLTFPASEFFPAPASVSRLPAATIPVPSDEMLPALRAHVPEARWLELLEKAAVLATDPPARASRIPSVIVENTLLDGADLVALRTVDGTTVGVALPDTEQRRSLWCGVDYGGQLGSTVAALRAVTNTLPPAAPRSILAPEDITAAVVPVGDTNVAGAIEADAIKSFMDRAPELLGVMRLDASGAVFGFIREGQDGERFTRLLVRRRVALDTLLPGVPREEPVQRAPQDELTFRLTSIVTGEKELWCFGAELTRSPGTSLWMFTDKHSAQGLGWAYLASLARQIDEAIEVGRPAQPQAQAG